MRTSLFYLLLSVVLPLSEAAAQRSQVLPKQESIATDLRSTDIPTLLRGVSDVTRIPYQKWTPTLRSAILYALESEIQQDLEARRARVYRWHDEPARLELAYFAIVMQDPAAIPSLVLMSGEMSYARSALAAFGRQALPDVIRVAKGDDYFDVKGCLITLRVMVQQWGGGYFTAQERAQLKAVADLYLSPSTPKIRTDWGRVKRAYTLLYAAMLALVLEDAEARMWVERLATDAEALQEKAGDRTLFIQKDLQEVLGGGPMLPPTYPLSKILERYGGGG